LTHFSTLIDHIFEIPYGSDASYPLPQEDIEEFGFLESENKDFEQTKISCKVEEQVTDKNPKSKRIEGQPSKNLVAERRR